MQCLFTNWRIIVVYDMLGLASGMPSKNVCSVVIPDDGQQWMMEAIGRCDDGTEFGETPLDLGLSSRILLYVKSSKLRLPTQSSSHPTSMRC